MEYRKQISFENGTERWLMTVQPEGTIIVTCNGETRTYDIPEEIKDVIEEDNYVFVYVNDDETKFYQFKFEDGNFLVGDEYDQEDEYISAFACHVFGE